MKEVFPFAYPWMLALLPVVPVLGLIWAAMRGRARKRIAAMSCVRGKEDENTIRRFLARLQMPLTMLAMILLVCAVARPRWGEEKRTNLVRSRNVVIALDVSRSMLAADVQPNRLERAKADIVDLIDSLGNDRAALVVFRRTGVALCPLTTDRAFLRSALESATPDSAPRGETDIGSAIRASLAALDPAMDEHNAIIIISDGGDLRGAAVAEARAAKRRGVPIFTVGIGDPLTGAKIPDADGKGAQKYQGNEVTVKLEEEALRAVAKESDGGVYVSLATAGTAETTLGAIYRRFLREVAQKEQAEDSPRIKEQYHLFLLPAVVIFILVAMSSRGRFRAKVKKSLVMLAVLGVLGTAHGDEGTEMQSWQRWNQGVEQYLAGNETNAMETLSPLVLDRKFGGRASEVVGAIEYARGNREAAVEAMQRSLRAAPNDARTIRNFTRVADRIEEYREEKHIEKVLNDTKDKSPEALIAESLRTVRPLLIAAEEVLTNEASVAVARSEKYSAQMRKAADVWIPLKQMIVQNVTNEQQAAYVVQEVENARAATKRAADMLEDMELGSADEIAKAENLLTRFHKMVVSPPSAIDEDILAETNEIAKVERVNGRDWQHSALEYTQVFRAKFPEWAANYEQQAQSDTNKPPFTKEAQAEISALSTEVEKLQLELDKASPRDAEKMNSALTKLLRIKELLPKDGNGGGQNQNNNQQDNNQNQDENKDDQNNDSDEKNENDDSQPQDQPEESQTESAAANDNNEQASDEEVEAMFKRARERNDEHENEKKMRARSNQRTGVDRDW